MIDMNVTPKRAALVIVTLALSLIAGAAYLLASTVQIPAPHGAPAEPTNFSQPKIAWSTSSVNVILAAGQSSTVDMTFTSSFSLQKITIEAVREIAGFLKITPGTISTVNTGNAQAVHLVFSAAAGATLGTYTGTIHLRSGTDTLPQTLKVTIKVWQAAQLTAGHFTIDIPPQWSAQVTPTEIDIATADLKALASTQDAEVPPADFTVRTFPRTANVSFDGFINQFDHGWFRNYSKETASTLNGHSVVVFSDANATVAHQPALAAFIDDPESSQVVFVTMMRVAPGDIEGTFLQVLSTAKF